MSAAHSGVPADTLARQRRASHPGTSAWVSANAGSGKTHVLTQRVLRLLLGGVAPARILCLTFTKAAAANMSIRVFDRLAGWTRLSDTQLSAEIVETGASQPSATDLAFARKLFARTVETPGGLKIQTIHAFCERVLHLFPFEANVAAQFSVLDDVKQQELLGDSQRAVLAEAVGQAETRLSRALVTLAEEASATTFEALVGEALNLRANLAAALDAAGTMGAFEAALAKELGLAPNESPESVEACMLDEALPVARWATTALQLGADGSAKDTTGNRLATAARTAGPERLSRYLDVFLTKERAARADKYLVKAQRTELPALCAELDAERDRLVLLEAKRQAAVTLKRTIALADIAKAVLDRYQAAKQRRGLLDFDDLVERTLTLLNRASAAWVLYKLDAGIDHVLVDEAQDTSPAQWRILRAITADFFVGQGQSEVARTMFAVGDEKQSIFSFQGADPRVFADMHRVFATDAKAGERAFESVSLNLSFRSTEAILEAVDRIFAAEDHARGLVSGDTPPPHVAMRARTPGLVELWPAVEPPPQIEPPDWRLPVDLPNPSSPALIVAGRVASTIAGLIAPGSQETVEDGRTGARRPVRAGDVMILVRSRNAFFEAVIRALKEAGVPVAGADRLQLTEHIAVMDLMAAGRAALLPDDDLTLACVLKSPLMGLDDDDLIALAPARRGSLAKALEQSDKPEHRAAAARLRGWRDRAAATTPFGFYMRLLGADGGRRAMLGRLGPEAGDALDEFLALTLSHERDGAPSLLAFLARLENQSLSIKRDMDAAGNAVRVMTVHAAKGLEAKVVFLPDTCGAPSGRHDPNLFLFPGRDYALLAWSPRKDADAPAIAAARAALRQAAQDEHRRLLYVALTRAEERLYIAGFDGAAGRAEGCWYDMIAASDLGLIESPAPYDHTQTIRHRRDPGLTVAALDPVSDPRHSPPLPAWLTAIPRPEVAYAPPLRPSNALGAADQLPVDPDAFGLSTGARQRHEAALIGRLAHHLLQHLPNVPQTARRSAALRHGATHGKGLPPERLGRLVDDLMSVIDMPALGTLFAPGSQAEVGVAGRVTLPDGRSVEIAGQIDRIGVGESDVMIADFKTGKPHDLNTVPPSYVAQLALYRAAIAPLYPGKAIHAALVWTTGPTVLVLPPTFLDSALAVLVT